MTVTLLSFTGTAADTGIPNWLAGVLLFVAGVLYLRHLLRSRRRQRILADKYRALPRSKRR